MASKTEDVAKPTDEVDEKQSSGPAMTTADSTIAEAGQNVEETQVAVDKVEQTQEDKQAADEEGKCDQAEGGVERDKEKSNTKEKSNSEERQVVGQEGDEAEKAAMKKELESIDVSKEAPLDDGGRMSMFEEGLKNDKDGKKTEALKCYLKCLVGLKENSRFSLLPQCLRNIGDIYYKSDQSDEKAISFIQAEKLYYESVLIDDTQLQKHIDEVMAKTEDESSSDPDMNIDAMRATEYEQLAKLCMDEKQPQLALEYAGKATKLRQQVYGDGHPLVQQTLDYFATVYAEVGKVQYSESMSKFAAAGEPDMTGGATLSDSNSPEPTSILRKRRGETAGEREKRVRFDESQVPSEEVMEREEKCARTVLFLLFLSLCFILVLLGLYIYCNIQRSSQCVHYRQLMHDFTMKLRYWYYHYSSTKDNKYT